MWLTRKKILKKFIFIFLLEMTVLSVARAVTVNEIRKSKDLANQRANATKKKAKEDRVHAQNLRKKKELRAVQAVRATRDRLEVQQLRKIQLEEQREKGAPPTTARAVRAVKAVRETRRTEEAKVTQAEQNLQELKQQMIQIKAQIKVLLPYSEQEQMALNRDKIKLTVLKNRILSLVANIDETTAGDRGFQIKKIGKEATQKMKELNTEMEAALEINRTVQDADNAVRTLEQKVNKRSTVLTAEQQKKQEKDARTYATTQLNALKALRDKMQQGKDRERLNNKIQEIEHNISTLSTQSCSMPVPVLDYHSP